jgi:hypothetical protein
MGAITTGELAPTTVTEVAMKKLALLFFALSIAISTTALAKGGSKGGSHSVRGHTTKKGVYVQPHRKTNPDNSKSNNYSHKGNTNPNTGREGTKD